MSLTFERVREHIGAIPTMHPRPTFDNISQAVLHLIRKLQQLPAPHQSTRNGYAGKIMSVQQYALLDTQAWIVWPYPGPHHTIPASVSATLSLWHSYVIFMTWKCEKNDIVTWNSHIAMSHFSLNKWYTSLKRFTCACELSHSYVKFHIAIWTNSHKYVKIFNEFFQKN